MTQIRMRGLRPDATAVLVDGMRFRDPSTTQGDSTSFLSTLNFVSAGRVEILRGSGSSLYGSNAVGGAINLMTDEGGGPTRGEVQIEGGGFGFARGRASLSGGMLNDRLRYTAGLTHINLMNGIDENDRLRNTGGQAFLSFQIAPTMKVTGRFYGADDFGQTNVSPSTAGIPAANFPATGIIPAIPLAADQVENLNGGRPVMYGDATYIPSRDDPDNRRASRFYTTGFAFYHAPSDTASWQVTYNRVQTRRVFLSGPAGGGFQPASLSMTNPAGDIDTVNARVNLRPFSQYQLTGGYEFEDEEFRDHQDNFLPPPRQVRVFGFFKQRSNAAFMQHQVSLLQSRLQLSMSGRIQSFNLSRPEFQATGITNVYEGVEAQNPRRGLTGDVSLAYLFPQTGTKVRTHVGNAYRAPSLFERYGGGYTNNPATGAVGLSPYGDPRLSPDRYNSFDFGFDQYIGQERARVSATYFYTRVQQVIIFDFSGAINPATDPFGRFIGYLQSPGGISRGVELSAESRPIPSLALSGSYTFTNSVNDRDIEVRGFVRSLTIPRHTFTLVARKELGKRADVTFDLFHGSSYFLSFFAGTGSRPFEFPGFTKADLAGGYRVWQSDNQSVRLYGKVENVFNQTYYENGWVAPGAWAIAGMTYRF
jgi:iron complex outermembrane receptor protein